ncbi:MAG: sulfurtransferase [Gammaproteobacteria bacterium]|nr:sulfurtransferase [Gammaproteobacteria bacterium]
MTTCDLPAVIEPEDLHARLGSDLRMLIVDLCKDERFAQAHIAGAVHLEYRQLVTGTQPAPGQIPPPEQLSDMLSALGCRFDSKVVAYDDEGGGKAARFLWTLDVVGHPCFALLNGGILAWAAENYPVTADFVAPSRSDYPVSVGDRGIADLGYIRTRLGHPQFALLDARTPAEFDGSQVRAARGGHIPGAKNLNWLDTLDPQRNYRFKPNDELITALAERGLTPDRDIVTYCHTHHRSAHSYIMLKHLGYTNLSGYPGSWSEWGNRTDTPVET